MEYSTILFEERGHTGIITLNRPKEFNTFNSPMAQELNGCLLACNQNNALRAVIIKAAGKTFSTGIDVREFFDKNLDEYREWITLMDRMHKTIASMKIPVIAMVHGYAVANGAGLVAAADFAVISQETKIGTTAINIGLLCTGPIIPMSLGLGKKKTLELLLCGDMIDAMQALDLGLVNRVVPRERLEEETLALAEKLASKSPLAVHLGKSFYYEMIDRHFWDRFDLHSEVFSTLCTSEDAREGVCSFLEKRAPEWRGR
ncbi:MAG: enoyl-CoA hydratase/isomerase family protein [Desulfomonilia bacterium]